MEGLPDSEKLHPAQLSLPHYPHSNLSFRRSVGFCRNKPAARSDCSLYSPLSLLFSEKADADLDEKMLVVSFFLATGADLQGNTNSMFLYYTADRRDDIKMCLPSPSSS